PLVKRLAEAIGYARAIEDVTMDDQARTIWHAVYPELSEGLPGLLGAVISAPRRKSSAWHCCMRY
ncbi:MAG: hypothetical protein M3120_04300, partial [Pseudomonadota bacterium]|nr:hypothetical protein [Pseudomonadota bacterium]